MADFKFSCPGCGQHIQCDTGYAGAQINCPSCQKTIVVPQAPRSAAAPTAPPQAPRPAAAPAAPYIAPPPPVPPAVTNLATKQNTMIPPPGKRFAGAPSLTGAPPPKPKSKALQTVLIITAAVVVLAGLGVGGWVGFSKFKEHKAAETAKKGNPAAQVVKPNIVAATGALGLLGKVHSAYTNLSSESADGTFTLFLNLSNLTMADINPDMPANAKSAKRRPQNMPNLVTNKTEVTVKRAQSNWYYFSGEAVSKVDRMTISNTFAFWSSDKGTFTFNDNHLKGMAATYMQLADANNPANGAADQFKKFQHLFEDPANLAKIIKDLGQTDDEPVNGQDCHTLTAKVLGQKVKVWVDKDSYLISQWQITLGGAISDSDIDDAVSLFAAAGTDVPPAQLDMAKAEVKKRTPAMTKIRGTVTFTVKNIRANPALSSDDFNYPVPSGVRLRVMPNASTANTQTTSLGNRQRNTCINNLRQIDAAKNQWALEKGKKNGDACAETDIKPYLAGGKLPTCPAGGKYTIGKAGETPTCSIAGHTLQ
jgi:outer membrane lipoprotein-sorting protein